MVTLQRLLDLHATHRDIRKSVSDSIAYLKDTDQSAGIRAASAIGILTQAADNSNASSVTRVALWKALSELELVRE